jgi:hypothetical protein
MMKSIEWPFLTVPNYRESFEEMIAYEEALYGMNVRRDFTNVTLDEFGERIPPSGPFIGFEDMCRLYNITKYDDDYDVEKEENCDLAIPYDCPVILKEKVGKLSD